MFERKGIQFFLRALQGMKLHHEVHIVGDGPYLPALKALAGELGVDARFWGWLDRGSAELRNLYDSSEIYVFPSEAENFPLVLLEAMRAGAAIITTKGTGCAEVVGDTALLVGPRDPESIRAALTRLTADRELCRRLSVSAQARMRDNFTWPAVAGRYLECYPRPRLSPIGVSAVMDVA
jgi:glycosyltransferase involved in cell wall biosynthesis